MDPSLPQLALGPLSQLAVAALREIWSEIDERIAADVKYKREHPCEARTYHRVMANVVPRWSWLGLARVWHRAAARRWGAWCTAHERAICEQAAAKASESVARMIVAAREVRS